MLHHARAFIGGHTSVAMIVACATSACTAEIDGTSVPPPATAGKAGAGTGGGSGASGGSGGAGVGGSAGSGASAGTGVSSGGSGAVAASGGTGSIGSGGSGSIGGGGSAGGVAACTPAALPFRVMTRLNRAEYDNTARDLLGDANHLPLTILPADAGDGAFDNNAAALTIAPSLVERYVELAQALAEGALAQGSPGRAMVLTCQTQDDACARQIAASFAPRAWRRPTTTAESDGLFALYTDARMKSFSFEEGVQSMLAGALLSPDFLFRPELDQVLDSPEVHDVTPHELATRLSYFLWSSMPDAALTSAATTGALATTDGVMQQVQRMWADPKADAFVTRFPGLWLRTADVTISKQPAEEIFPDWDPALEAAMEGETSRFMRDMITGDVDFLSFLDARYTYVNQRLAQFYGIAGQFGNDLQRVELAGNTQRGGILTHASMLTVTSEVNRTSPTKRGQWVLARIVAEPAPPPDDAVAMFPEVGDVTIRQKLEMHRADPACAGCHNLMDPIGLGLENYDGIGKWRTTEASVPVDASGEIEPGGAFDGALELSALLKADPRVPRAVVQYVTSYALGRELGAADQCLVDSLTQGFEQDGRRMPALVGRVATTDAVRQRRGAQ